MSAKGGSGPLQLLRRTPAVTPASAAAGELRAGASSPRIVEAPRGAVLPATTGCPQPCSPTPASWCFWEVGAALPPTGSLPEFGREGARRLMFLGKSVGTAMWAYALGR